MVAIILRLSFALSVIFMVPNISEAVYQIKKMEMLPNYCRAVYPNWDHPKAKYYKAYFGPIGWGGWHHYCFGLDKINLALLEKNKPNRRKYWLESAVSEFDFLLNWWLMFTIISKIF